LILKFLLLTVQKMHEELRSVHESNQVSKIELFLQACLLKKFRKEGIQKEGNF